VNKLLRLLLVRENEKATVFYFLSFFFIVGCGMAMGKSSAEALFFKRYGIEYLPYIYLALGVLLAVISLAYATFADRLAAETFFLRLFIILAVLLVICWFAINQLELSAAYPVYFLIYEAASELFMIHSALYISQNLDSFKSKRLSPIILAGSQFGLIFGGLLVAVLAPVIGVDKMILLWSLLLLSACYMLLRWHRRQGTSTYFFRQQSKLSLHDSLKTINQGIHFSKHSPLLMASLLAFFFLVITFYTLHFVTNQIYTNYFTSEESLTVFFGILTACTSILGLLIQLFITNRAVKRFGIPKLNLVFPSSVSASFILLFFIFKLPVAIFASLVKDTIQPALNTPVRNMIFNILPKNIQGRIRAVLLAIVLPVALISCSLLLLLARHLENDSYFLLTGILASLLLLLFSIKVSRQYLSTLIQHLKEQVFLPHDKLQQSESPDLIKAFEIQLNETDDSLLIRYANILIKTHPQQMLDIVFEKIDHLSPKTIDKLLQIIAIDSTRPSVDFLMKIENSEKTDNHLRASLLMILFQQKYPGAKEYIQPALNHINSRLAIAGIYGALELQHHRDEAIERWISLMSETSRTRLYCLPLVAAVSTLGVKPREILKHRYIDLFESYLESQDQQQLLETLNALASWPFEVSNAIQQKIPVFLHHASPDIRAALPACARLMPQTDAINILLQSLDDCHTKVRENAAKFLVDENNNITELAEQWLLNDNYMTPRAQQSLLQHLIDARLGVQCLEQITNNKIRLARKFYDAQQLLLPFNNKDTACYLLHTTVKERMHQTLQLLLLILEKIEQPELVSVTQAAINSSDPLLIASACEALKNLNHNNAAELLIDILQDDFELKTNYILSFQNSAETLDWCQQQDDWLHQCAVMAEKQVLSHA